jgi:outer membrane protein assembly factor BamD (BamD/ComL family)
MHGKVKLTKRQIKEDKFATFMLSAKEQITTNWQYFVVGTAAFIIIIVAGVYFINSYSSAQAEAGKKFATSQMDYRSGNTQVAILGLNQIVEENKDESTTRQALFLLGRINLETKNYPEAIRYFDDFVTKFKTDKFMCASALAGIAACYENQGKFSEAASKYTEAVQADPDGPAEEDYLVSSVRTYVMAGDTEKAKTSLNTIKDKYKGTEQYLQAQRFFSEKVGAASGS